MPRSIVLSIFLFLTTIAGVAVARADEIPARVALTWSAPSECIEESRLMSAIETMLEHSVWESHASADVELDASLVREERDWVLRATLRAGETVFGTREVRRSAERCHTIDSVVVVVLALLVDLPRRDVLLRVPSEIPEPEPAVAPLLPEPPEPTPKLIELRLGASALFDVGTLAQPSFGGELSLSLSPARFWPFFRLSGRALAPVDTPLDPSGRGARIWAFGSALDVCPEATLDIFAFGFCAGVGVDALVGSGLGLDGMQAAVGTRWSGQASGGIGARFDAFEARISAGAIFTISRDSFVRDLGSPEERVLHAPAWVAFGLTLGVIFRLAP